MFHLHGKHIDNRKLHALVPSRSETPHEMPPLSPELLREAENHVQSCWQCASKVSTYRQLIEQLRSGTDSRPQDTKCPQYSDVDWHEVAARLRSELKAERLVMHAATCDYCGSLLRAAAALDNDPTPEEEQVLAELRPPSRPLITPVSSSSRPWHFTNWLVPVAALLMIVGLVGIRSSSQTPLSGPKFAEFALNTHRDHVQGKLALEVRSESQQTLNQWFKTKSPFALALPVSALAPGEPRPYRLLGASLVRVGERTGIFLAYQVRTTHLQTEMQSAASLTVAPDSVAQASGGIEVHSGKLDFHYSMIEGDNVVLWSQHGLTYALVSEEGDRTQASCMVCHAEMKDRDFTQTPTPLQVERNLRQVLE